MRKRILAAALSLCLVLSLLPTVAFAADASDSEDTLATSGTCGATESDQVAWSFDSDTGVLTISGTGAMAEYYFTNKSGEGMHTTAPWKAYDAAIKKVVIEEGVTTIGSHAFFRCNNLESVTIPESVLKIHDRAFWQTSLQHIAIPASVTEIGGDNERTPVFEVFYQCYDLEDITVAEGNQNYKSVDGVLYTSDGKTLVQYPQNKATSDYKVIDGATTIDVLAISSTQNLETLDLNGVTEIKKSGVYGNEKLAAITLENAMSLGDQAFSGNHALKSVEIKQVPTALGSSVFQGCTSLESVSLPDAMTTLGDGMFANCPALTSIKLPSALQTIGKNCFSNAIAKKGGLKGDLVIPETVTTIGDVAFGWNDIQSLTIEGTPTFAANSAFAGCSNIQVAKVKNVSYLSQINQTTVPSGYLESFWFTEGYENDPNGGWSGGQVKNSGTDELKTFYRVYNKEISVSSNGGINNGDKKTVYAYIAPELDEGKVLYLNNSNFSTKNNNIKSSDFTRDGYTFKEWTGDAAGTKPYEIGKKIYNYMPDALYAQWGVKIVEDTYFVYPVIEDQTYTGSELKPAVKVTKNGEEITEGFTVEYTNNTDVGTATATVKVDDTVIGTATFQIVKAKVIVAQVGTQGYETLADAIAAAQSGDTVKLLSDIEGMTSDQIITIPAGKNFTLDMNGKHITVASDDFKGRPIVNEGTLVVTGNGTIDSSASVKGGFGAIYNTGTLTIENGTFDGSLEASGSAIRNTGAAAVLTVNDGTFEKATCAIYNEGKVTINGGTFASTSCNSCDSVLRAPAVKSVKAGAVMEINGGTFIGTQGAVSVLVGKLTVNGGYFKTVDCANKHGAIFYALYAAGENGPVDVVINGGTFETEGQYAAVLIGNDGDGGAKAQATAEIKGGTFKAPDGVPAVKRATETGKVAISGGVFSAEPEKDCLAAGFEAVLVNGVYQAQKATEKNQNKYEVVLETTTKDVSAGDKITYTVKLVNTGDSDSEIGYFRITPPVNSEMLELDGGAATAAGVTYSKVTGNANYEFTYAGSKDALTLAQGEELEIGTLTYTVKAYGTNNTAVTVASGSEDDQVSNPTYKDTAALTVQPETGVTYHVIKVTFKQDDDENNDKVYYARYNRSELYNSLADMKDGKDLVTVSNPTNNSTKYRLKDEFWHKNTAAGDKYTAETTFTENATYVTNRVDLVKVTIPTTPKVTVVGVVKRGDPEGTYVDKGEDLTFTVADDETPGEKFEVTVKVGENEYKPTPDADGNYKVDGKNIIGEVEITVKSVLDLDENDIKIFTKGTEGRDDYAYLPYSTYSGDDTLVLIQGKDNASYTLGKGYPTIYRTDAYKDVDANKTYTHAVLVPKPTTGDVSAKTMLKYLKETCGLETSETKNTVLEDSWDTNGNKNTKRDLGDVQAANDFKTLKELKWTPTDDLLLLANVVTLREGEDANKYNDSDYTVARDGYVSDADVSAFVYRYAKLG